LYQSRENATEWRKMFSRGWPVYGSSGEERRSQKSPSFKGKGVDLQENWRCSSWESTPEWGTLLPGHDDITNYNSPKQ